MAIIQIIAFPHGIPALDSVRHALSAEGLAPETRSLQEMAKAIEPIIDGFDEVLVRVTSIYFT